MKQDAVFLNLSRGNIADLNALKVYLKHGKLKGAAIDVFPDEPFGNVNNFKKMLAGITQNSLR